MNFVEYKFGKATFDMARAHNVMMEASDAARADPVDAAVPSHRAFNALDHTLDRMRYVADDILTDLGNCWDVFLKDYLTLRRVPQSGPRQGGDTGARSLEERLAALTVLDAGAGPILKAARDRLFDRLKDARNAYSHRDFWTHTFEASFPSDSPFLMDLKWDTAFGPIAVVRDCSSRDPRAV